jgi:sugar phosphate isomerase/epimerase
VLTRREFVAAGLGTVAAGVLASEQPPAANLGLLIYSYGLRAKAEAAKGFSDPVRFLTFARSRGASAVQVPLGIRSEAEAHEVRKTCAALSMTVEGIVRPPSAEKADQERFSAELATAKFCGASVVRTVMLGGRRYEVFHSADEYAAFARESEAALQRAEPIARRHGVVLAVENHKDFRTDELLGLLRRFSSEWIGVCVDTGNNVALLEEPQRVVEALAPLARTVHLKDVAMEEAEDGFRLAEVPLGQGCLDLKAMVATLRKANPKIRFQLEMITRDPLTIPCLTDKYWATLERVPGQDLARSLVHARRVARKTPLPRVTRLASKEQLDLEDRQVAESFAFVARTNLLES